MASLLTDRIKKMQQYKIEQVAVGEIKLDAQENPYEIDADILDRIRREIYSLKLNRYPDGEYRKLKKQIGQYCGLRINEILVGNGSDELIMSVLLACGGHKRIAVSCSPTFSMYSILSELTDTEYMDIPLKRNFELDVEKIIEIDPDIIFIAYPNNPTGNCFFENDIVNIIEKTKGLVVIDEAYYEFSGKTFVEQIRKYPNVVILRTFSKAFSLAGIRAGYLMGRVSILKHIRKVQLPYNLSIVNQKILEIAMEERKKILKSVEKLIKSRDYMFKQMKRMKGIIPYVSEANFILMKINNPEKIIKGLLMNKINIRRFNAPGLNKFLRVTIGTVEENTSFIKSLSESI